MSTDNLLVVVEELAKDMTKANSWLFRFKEKTMKRKGDSSAVPVLAANARTEQYDFDGASFEGILGELNSSSIEAKLESLRVYVRKLR